MDAMTRIERLRKEALDPVVGFHLWNLRFNRRFLSLDTALPLEERYAQAYASALAQAEVSISPDELIVGKADTPLTEEQLAEFLETTAAIAAHHCMDGQDSHMAIDYDLVLSQGLCGIMADIDRHLATETDAKKVRFYRSCRACLEAMAAFADRYAQEAATLAAAETDARRKTELAALADICARVPRYPACTFHEAVQAVHFVTFVLSFLPLKHTFTQYQLGHPDRYLYPYYQADIAAGRLTPDFAQLLLDCLAIQINRRVPHGLSCGYMVGGRDGNGNIVANELTVMGMQVIDDIRLVYPSVGLCYTDGMPDHILDTACTILSHGRSHPAIFNDDVIAAGLKTYGLSEQEAHNYIHSTCVEITPVAASNVWVASPYVNMPQLLLDTLREDYADFESLKAAYFARLDAHIDTTTEDYRRMRRARRDSNINPPLSCFVNDCLEKGVDIEQGGARYNWIMPSFVGVGNAADSLFAVKTALFDEQRVSQAQLRAALADNFENDEALRLYLLNSLPKYGNDDDRVDGFVTEIVDHIVATCRRYPQGVLENSALVPSVFCWIMHERLGSETGATPDGRPQGFPFGDGSGPCQGRERCGPTASVLSSTKWSHKELIGGVAVNMKFAKKTFTADSGRIMRTIIETYLKRGGFEMQINVVDRDTLLAAQQSPEQYRDLVVRIGGYSDYFVTLSPAMQAEVLLRTEHEI